jgi:hypothetical protein
MMMKNKKGKCFIDKKPCREDCVLYRKGVRYYDAPGKDPEPFEECALNIIADGVENMISRTIGLQQEQNKVANSINGVSDLMKVALVQKINNKQHYEIK